ncbi:MAG: M20/M25/M40 family metallo-hydrolase [Acidobacteria bacterium]|nr:M20/M25/M40 family metallo-hydrolase [Acidobacteriota bacterium]
MSSRLSRDAWSTDPFGGEVRNGAVYGRGACDMKGGVAAMVFAAEALRELGLRLGGDLIVNTVSEEETTGAGGLVTARTVRADAAIVPEPSGLAVLTCCRGSLRDDRREWSRWPCRHRSAPPPTGRGGERGRQGGLPARSDSQAQRRVDAASRAPSSLSRECGCDRFPRR